MKFTLDQLAWFDRCLFPSDFKDCLIAEGARHVDAMAVYWFIVGEQRKGRPCGVVQIYQEYISDQELTSQIEKVVERFLNVGVVKEE